MDSVEIVGGILGENFALKFEPPGPEKEIVEIRIDDIQSDDDHLEDCNKSDIKENYCVQDEPIFIRQDRVPAVFRETLINVNDRTDNGTETKSDSDCEIIGVLEGKDKESKNNLIPETKSKDSILSYQEIIVNNQTNYFPKPRLKKIIQEQPVANTGSLLFSLLSKGSANRENIQTVAGYRKEKGVSGDSEINKNNNSDLGKSKAKTNQIKDPWQKQVNYKKRKNDIRKLLEQTKRNNSLKTQEEYRLLLQDSNLDKQKMKHSRLQLTNIVPSVIQNVRTERKYDHYSKGIHERQLNKVLCNSSKNKGHIGKEIFKKNNKSENQKVQNNKDIYCKTDYKNNFMQSESKGKQEKELNGQSKKEYGKNKQSVKGESTDEDPFDCSSDDDGGNFEDDLDLDLTRKTLQKKAQPTRRNIIVSSTADYNCGVIEVDNLCNDSQEANRKQGKNHLKESKKGEKGKSKEVSKKVVARQDVISISNTSDNNKGESWPEKLSEATSKERRHEKILENSEKVVESALVINSTDNNHKKSCDDSNQEKSWLNESSHDDQGAYRLQKKNSVKNGKGEKNKGVSEKMAASARQNDTDTNNTNDVKYDEDKRKECKEGEGKELELKAKLVASKMQAVIDNSTIDNDNHDECLPDALNNDYQGSNKIQKNKIVNNDKKEVSLVEELATHLCNGNNIGDNNNHNKSLSDESSNGDQQSNEISKKDPAENDKKAEDKKNKAISEKSEKISASARQNVIHNSSTNDVNYNEDKRKEGKKGDEQKLEELPEKIIASAMLAGSDDSFLDDDNHDESWPDASNNDGNKIQENIFDKNAKKKKEVLKVGEPARQHLTDGNSICNNNHKKSCPNESSNHDQQTNKINKKDFVKNNKKAEDKTNKEESEQIAAPARHDGIVHSDANDNHDESWPDKSINDNQGSNEVQKRTFIKKSKRGEKRKHEVLENIAAYAKEAVNNIYDSDDNDQDNFVPGETGEKRKLEALSSKTENCTKKVIREHILLSKSIEKESETVNQNQGVNRTPKVNFNIKNSKSGEKKLNELFKTKKIVGFEGWINKSVNLTKPEHKQENRKEIQKKLKENEVSCPHCSMLLKKCSLRNHILSKHTDERNISYLRCHQCEYKAKMKELLRRHIIYKHTEPGNMMEDMKKCDQCPKMFKRNDKLKLHILHLHKKDEVKKLKCPDCEYECNFVYLLRNHRDAYHSNLDNVEALQCAKCSYKTKIKYRLKIHMMVQHKNRLQCEKCAYETSIMEKMKIHLIGHKEIKDDADLKYRCDKCDYKTYRQHSLNSHKLKHLKPDEIQYFYCYHCNFKAKRKDNLKTHVLRHFKHNEVTNQCYICDFSTTKKHLLISHIDKHSKGLIDVETKKTKVNKPDKMADAKTRVSARIKQQKNRKSKTQ